MYPSTPPPYTFPLSPNKGGGCCIFSCNITPPSPAPLIVIGVSTMRRVCQSSTHTERERERDACQCCILTTITNSRLGCALSWEGFQRDTFFYLDGRRWRRRRRGAGDGGGGGDDGEEITQKPNIICIYSSLKKSLESCGCHRRVPH